MTESPIAADRRSVERDVLVPDRIRSREEEAYGHC
jgi:hypothetical protein